MLSPFFLDFLRLSFRLHKSFGLFPFFIISSSIFCFSFHLYTRFWSSHVANHGKWADANISGVHNIIINLLPIYLVLFKINFVSVSLTFIFAIDWRLFSTYVYLVGLFASRHARFLSAKSSWTRRAHMLKVFMQILSPIGFLKTIDDEENNSEFLFWRSFHSLTK